MIQHKLIWEILCVRSRSRKLKSTPALNAVAGIWAISGGAFALFGKLMCRQLISCSVQIPSAKCASHNTCVMHIFAPKCAVSVSSRCVQGTKHLFSCENLNGVFVHCSQFSSHSLPVHIGGTICGHSDFHILTTCIFQWKNGEKFYTHLFSLNTQVCTSCILIFDICVHKHINTYL